MMVFQKENLVFFAIPKTGTTALEAALAHRATIIIADPPNAKHMTPATFTRVIRPLIQRDHEMMAVIRHPLDWHGSHFRYRTRAALDGTMRSTAHMSFEEFIRSVLPEEGGTPSGSQSKFLTLPNGHMPVQHLFRYEAQAEILKFLTERFGEVIAPPRVNVSPEFPLTLPYDLRAAHERAFAPCYALWAAAQH